MTKTDELLREFAIKHGHREYFKDGDIDGFNADPRFLSDLRTLIKQVEEERMPSEEEIRKQGDLKFDNFLHKALWGGGALWVIEWFRNRMSSTEKPNNSEQQMGRDIQEADR